MQADDEKFHNIRVYSINGTRLTLCDYHGGLESIRGGKLIDNRLVKGICVYCKRDLEKENK